jgi:hypothetical protein
MSDSDELATSDAWLNGRQVLQAASSEGCLHAKDYPTAFAPIRPVSTDSSHNATGAAPLSRSARFRGKI